MKTRALLSGLLFGSLLALEGCGAGQYNIPNVEPVVKQKPEEDPLNIEGPSDKAAAPSESSAPSAAPSSTDDSSSDSSKSDSKSKK